MNYNFFDYKDFIYGVWYKREFELTEEQASLGLFKGKEKKALQAQIDHLQLKTSYYEVVEVH